MYFFEVTRACNLRCQMCQYIDFLENVAVREQRAGELDTAQWLEVIDQIPLLSLVTFSGGELFVRSDMLEILEAACRRARVHLITNGTLLTAPRVDKLAALFARRIGQKGINVITVSVDGPPDEHDRIRRREGSFARSADGLRRLHAARLRCGRRVPLLTTTTVIQNDNADRLAEMPPLMAELGVDIVNFVTETRINDLAAFGESDPRSIRTRDSAWPSVDRARLAAALDALVAAARASRVELRLPRMPREMLLDYYDRGCSGVETRLDLREFDCLAPWYLLAVDPWGNAWSCPSFKIGNVKDTTVADLWNGRRARDFRIDSRSGLFAFCPGCCSLEHCSMI
jgi:MoaA/NifB/PqqE/SkfB family radical SAM enzyme